MRRSEVVPAFSGSARARFVVAVFTTLTVYGCSATGSGCGGLTKIPTAGGRFEGKKNDNAVNVRLTGAGLAYINNNWPSLVDAFGPGGVMTVEVPCSKMSINPIGTVTIGDQGNAGGSGKLDGACDAQDTPAKVQITVGAMKLLPVPPDKVSVELTLVINTGRLYAMSPQQVANIPCNLKCSLEFNNGPTGNTFSTTVRFTVDNNWDNVAAFNIEQFNGTQVCGSAGANASPACLDPGQVQLNNEGGCGFVCSALDWAPVKKTILELASPLIQDRLRRALAVASCEPCGKAKSACPTTSNTGHSSTCVNADNNTAPCDMNSDSATCFCRDTQANACVPRAIGVEGRLSVAPLLSAFGVATDAQMDLSVALGNQATVDTGLILGSRVGVKAVQVSSCVTPQMEPNMAIVPAPNFDGEATPGSNYHVGLGISSSFLNIASHNAQQAGALCLQLGTSNIGLLNTGNFRTFLPSLGALATRDGKDAPMLIALRPGRPPLVSVGLGTYDPITKKPIKPLITMAMPELSIDVYALIDDRYARLFTLTADITLPISLIFEGCDKVSPAIGDLKLLVSNIKTTNNEMLAEDPMVLQGLIPAVIGLAEPLLANLLQPLQLPTLGSFKLKVNEAKGVGNIGGSEAYNHLGIYATLLPAGSACAVSAPRTMASVNEAVMPSAGEMRLQAGKDLPWPKAILDVAAVGKEGSAEFAYRIDDGLWSTFVPAVGGKLTVSHPRFLIQGHHVISVRSRVAEDQHGVSAPVQVPFTVDFDGPLVTLTLDPASDRVVITAHDAVSADGTLEFAYAVGGEGAAFGEFGRAREISYTAVEAQGGVGVRVRDERGNVGEAKWLAPIVQTRSGDVATAVVNSSSNASLGGCSVSGGLELFGLTVLGLALRRRNRR